MTWTLLALLTLVLAALVGLIVAALLGLWDAFPDQGGD